MRKFNQNIDTPTYSSVVSTLRNAESFVLTLSQDRYKELAYNHKCVYNNVSLYIELKNQMQVLGGFVKSVLYQFESCVPIVKIQKALEFLRKTIPSQCCTNSSKVNEKVEEISRFEFLKNNPDWAGKKSYDEIKHNICALLDIDISVEELKKCDVSFDVQVEDITGNCDLDVLITLEEKACEVIPHIKTAIKECKFELDPKVSTKSCTLEYDLLTKEKKGCNVSLDVYTKLRKCNISHDVITSILACNMSVDFDTKTCSPVVYNDDAKIHFVLGNSGNVTF